MPTEYPAADRLLNRQINEYGSESVRRKYAHENGSLRLLGSLEPLRGLFGDPKYSHVMTPYSEGTSIPWVLDDGSELVSLLNFTDGGMFLL
jgi:hypothetical protein